MTVLVFDLETTSLSKNADILQIGAISDKTAFKRESVFNYTMLPKQPISDGATRVNQFTTNRSVA